MAYTDKLEIAIITRSVRLMVEIDCGIGINIQRDRAKVSAIIGAVINRAGEAAIGHTGSFRNSFTPSAIGCKSPINPTTLGPLRSCI